MCMHTHPPTHTHTHTHTHAHTRAHTHTHTYTHTHIHTHTQSHIKWCKQQSAVIRSSYLYGFPMATSWLLPVHLREARLLVLLKIVTQLKILCSGKRDPRQPMLKWDSSCVGWSCVPKNGPCKQHWQRKLLKVRRATFLWFLLQKLHSYGEALILRGPLPPYFHCLL